MASLSSRSLAVLAKANAYKSNIKKSAQTTQSKVTPVKAITNRINTVQTNLSRIGLGEKTLAAQKALAEKYGITTFDIKGNISQVPTTREIDTSINVGTGILINSSYNDSVKILVQQEQAKQTGAISGGNNSIITGITDFFDSFFHTNIINDIPAELKAQIQEIDDQIFKIKQDIDNENIRYQLEYSTISPHQVFSVTQLHQSRLSGFEKQITNLSSQKDRLLLDYKTQKEFLPKVQSLIDSLNLYGKIDTLTPQLKTEIQDRVSQASATIEKILGESLNISRSKIQELQQAMLLAVNVMSLPVTAAQQTAKADMDGTAEMIDLFGFLNPIKSTDDRVKEIIADYRAQKQAIIVLLQTGEFSK